jgi:predicted ATPase
MYILDEPEVALSPQRLFSFLTRLDELVKQKSQFIIATHSPILMSYPHANIIQISENGYQETTYKETDHYVLYKQFLDNPETMLKKLDIS